MNLPTHCLCCGVYLQGGATRHHPGCEIGGELLLASVLASLRDGTCECRTCHHRAADHLVDGSCLECGRIGCWT